MKLGQIADKDFQDALLKLMKHDIPIKTAYKLKIEIDKLKSEMSRYQELHQELLVKYGNKDQDGRLETDQLKNVRFKEEQYRQFMRELKELKSIDVEVKSISIDDIGDKIDISIDDLIMLDGLIT